MIRTLFQQKIEAVDPRLSGFRKLETLYVNLGDLCNLSCIHCHHRASPHGARVMDKRVMEKIVGFLTQHPGLTLDITGGCPEMNPDFRYLVEATAGRAARRIIRSNLVIALEPEMKWLPAFYREHDLVVMASLPCYGPGNVDKQRGYGVFAKSIEVLRRLNQQGFGSDLELHLVHNPDNGAIFAFPDMLEEHYRNELMRFRVTFSQLYCMNNAPLGRFRESLESKGAYQGYLDRMAELFNPRAAERIMCRTLVSVGWNGVLYNCDFNLAAALPLEREDGSLVTIDHIDEVLVPGRGIRTEDHCFSCTAGQGSGCGGLLATSGNEASACSITGTIEA